MATTEAAVPEDQHHVDHGHEHEHPPFLAHHFDTPEQQFDSGKQGIWIFLVTEVLFFSGMFCAYALFRMLRPEVFEGCSQFLNTQLGAINTGVLLFSSLTMAWAVRCAQTEEHKKLAALIATTLCCGMIFLGVKAIEYTHKWHMGLNAGSMFSYDPNIPHPEHGPDYLPWVLLPFIALTVGVIVWFVVALARGRSFQVACAKPLIFVCLSFFVGVGLGTVLEGGEQLDPGDDAHLIAEDGDVEGIVPTAEPQGLPGGNIGDKDMSVIERLAQVETNSGLQSELEARRTQAATAGSTVVAKPDVDAGEPISNVPSEVLTPRLAGVFFGIYYSMTGIHAVHIIAGLGVLVWLLVRAIRLDFNRQYFGPVDYVGLYWHLVDLIWIYLFPLLYLI